MDDGIERVVHEIRLEYLHTPVKIMITADVAKLSYAGKTVEDLKKGTVVNVWQWVAEVIVSMGYAEYVSKPLTATQLMQLEWREKNNPADIQPLDKHFYIEWTKEAEKGDRDVVRRLADIITMRMMKIIGLAAKRLDGDIVKKLTPEEEVLYRRVYSIVERWIKVMTPKGG
ncbi:MAG: hypothetical protein QW470_00165 [Candidatus Caldarchaeum sp.]